MSIIKYVYMDAIWLLSYNSEHGGSESAYHAQPLINALDYWYYPRQPFLDCVDEIEVENKRPVCIKHLVRIEQQMATPSKRLSKLLYRRVIS